MYGLRGCRTTIQKLSLESNVLRFFRLSFIQQNLQLSLLCAIVSASPFTRWLGFVAFLPCLLIECCDVYWICVHVHEFAACRNNMQACLIGRQLVYPFILCALHTLAELGCCFPVANVFLLLFARPAQRSDPF